MFIDSAVLLLSQIFLPSACCDLSDFRFLVKDYIDSHPRSFRLPLCEARLFVKKTLALNLYSSYDFITRNFHEDFGLGTHCFHFQPVL